MYVFKEIATHQNNNLLTSFVPAFTNYIPLQIISWTSDIGFQLCELEIMISQIHKLQSTKTKKKIISKQD